MVVESYPGVWRYIILAVSLFEILCFGAIIYGWGSLVYVLKKEGFLAELCLQQNQLTLESGENSSNRTQTDLNPECDQRDARFNLYFTIISSVGVLLVLLVGHSLTKLGTRKTRILFITMFGLGCLCIAASDAGYPWLICVGGILMIGSGNVYIVTSIQFTKLFPDHASTIVGLMNGMKISSSFTQQLVKIAQDNGVSRRISYCCLVGWVSLTYLSTIFLFPRGIPGDKEQIKIKGPGEEDLNEKEQNKAPSNTEDNKQIEVNESILLITSGAQLNAVKYTADETTETIEKLKLSTDSEPSPSKNTQKTVTIDTKLHKNAYDNLGFGERGNRNNYLGNIHTCQETDVDTSKTKHFFKGKTDEQDNDKENIKNDPSFDTKNDNTLSSNMCGYLYISNVLWFVIIKFWSNYFFGIVNPFTEKITHHDKAKVSYYADLLSYSMAGGIIGCIVVGLLYDWQRRFFVHIDDLRRRRVMSSVGPLIATCSVSLVLSSLLLVNDEWVLIALPIIFTLYRALLTTVGNTFLVDMFPASIYGTIYGFRFVMANLFSFIQYALFQWSLAYKGAEYHVDIFVLCLCLTSFVHPISIILANRNTKRVLVVH